LNQKEPHFIDGSKVDPKSACPAGLRPEQRTKKIFVGGLQAQTTEEKLKEYFGQFGEIRVIEFPGDHKTVKKRGFCFIEFANEGIVDRVVKQKFHEVCGKRLETKRALSKQQQAEEAAHLAGQSGATHSIAAVPHMVGAYGGIQQAGVIPHGQPIIYIHPDSLSTVYPMSALGYQGYPGLTGLSGGYETLYQPYDTGQVTQQAGSSVHTQRYTPYASKKY